MSYYTKDDTFSEESTTIRASETVKITITGINHGFISIPPMKAYSPLISRRKDDFWRRATARPGYMSLIHLPEC